MSLRNDIMRISVLRLITDIRIELQAPVLILPPWICQKRSYYLILKGCTALSAYIAVGSSGSGRRRGGSGGGHRRRHRVVVALVS